MCKTQYPCGYSSMNQSLSINTELKHSSIIAGGRLRFSLGLLLNSSTCYKFYYSLSKRKSRVEMKLNHCLQQILNFKSSVWTRDFSLRWIFNLHCCFKQLVNCEIQAIALDLNEPPLLYDFLLTLD